MRAGAINNFFNFLKGRGEVQNCVITNENGAFYRLGTTSNNSWTNYFDCALLMTEKGAKKIARKTKRAMCVIKNYTKVNPDGVTQGETVLDLEKK